MRANIGANAQGKMRIKAGAIVQKKIRARASTVTAESNGLSRSKDY